MHFKRTTWCTIPSNSSRTLILILQTFNRRLFLLRTKLGSRWAISRWIIWSPRIRSMFTLLRCRRSILHSINRDILIRRIWSRYINTNTSPNKTILIQLIFIKNRHLGKRAIQLTWVQMLLNTELISRILMFFCRHSQVILCRMITITATIGYIQCNQLTMSTTSEPNPLKTKCFNHSSDTNKKWRNSRSKESKPTVPRTSTLAATWPMATLPWSLLMSNSHLTITRELDRWSIKRRRQNQSQSYRREPSSVISGGIAKSDRNPK